MTATSTAGGINEWTFAKYIGQSLYIILMNEARLASWDGWAAGHDK